MNAATSREGKFQILIEILLILSYLPYTSIISITTCWTALIFHYIAMVLYPRYETWLHETELEEGGAKVIIQHIKEVLNQLYSPCTSDIPFFYLARI